MKYATSIVVAFMLALPVHSLVQSRMRSKYRSKFRLRWTRQTDARRRGGSQILRERYVFPTSETRRRGQSNRLSVRATITASINLEHSLSG